tara:strand:- start:327 stop:455 length:129 start_codon:yes stop_codon:yes gene_type:complete
MLNRYDVYERLAVIGELVGRALVFVGLACVCALMWYFIFQVI